MKIFRLRQARILTGTDIISRQRIKAFERITL